MGAGKRAAGARNGGNPQLLGPIGGAARRLWNVRGVGGPPAQRGCWHGASGRGASGRATLESGRALLRGHRQWQGGALTPEYLAAAKPAVQKSATSRERRDTMVAGCVRGEDSVGAAMARTEEMAKWAACRSYMGPAVAPVVQAVKRTCCRAT